MAMKKADYVAKGKADALAALPRMAIAAATWQAAAYDSGYDEIVRLEQAKMAASPVQESLVAAFRRGVAEADRRVFRDGARRAEAMVARIKHRQALRSLVARPAPKRFFHDPLSTVSHNIKRGSAMRKA